MTTEQLNTSHDNLRRLTIPVQPVPKQKPAERVHNWDEAFLGARTEDPEGLAAAIRAGVAEATGLSCSVGLGDDKLRAKNSRIAGSSAYDRATCSYIQSSATPAVAS